MNLLTIYPCPVYKRDPKSDYCGCCWQCVASLHSEMDECRGKKGKEL